jgi:hypothetical protein
MKELIDSYFDVEPGETFRLGSYVFIAHVLDGVLLFAPEEFWGLAGWEKDLGCGPGKFGDYAVPDTMLGLNVKSSCAIHDVCYALGKTDEDKVIADILFLMNALAIINAKSWPVIREARSYRAMTYYLAVSEGGESAFWKGKEKT